jgi:hypothetical protein
MLLESFDGTYKMILQSLVEVNIYNYDENRKLTDRSRINLTHIDNTKIDSSI